MHPIVASLGISMVIEQSSAVKNIAAVEIGSQRLKIHICGCVMMHINLVVQYFQQLLCDFIMSAIIKAIPHIADETANTKKQTDVNCELIENQQPSTTAANALVNPASAHITPYITRIYLLFRAADTVVFVVVVVEVFCSTQIITKAINKRIRCRPGD
ncbi:hypothetical protein T05_8580 [Trichinella murrelli]|uniref:Uncharacterized protein n=1 Tax=Trichinella murrelli TaxID=144512 RepID=A0A0V0UJ57_9BILA|nr:hypothetical protein T05_8580 [Trichinella murrelli]